MCHTSMLSHGAKISENLLSSWVWGFCLEDGCSYALATVDGGISLRTLSISLGFHFTFSGARFTCRSTRTFQLTEAAWDRQTKSSQN